MVNAYDPDVPRIRPICGSPVSKAILMIGMGLAYSYFTGRGNLYSATFSAILIGIGSSLWGYEINSQRTIRNSAAKEIYYILANNLLEGNNITINYSLYLRKFGTDAKNDNYGSFPMLHPIIADAQLLPHTFEAFLSDQMYGWCPLVAVGRLEENIGAGKITSDDTVWESRVQTLLKGAKLIFVVPQITQGIKWEISEIIRDNALISKTIIVIPPKFYLPNMASEWDSIKNELQSTFGLLLPNYNDRGLVFKLSDLHNKPLHVRNAQDKVKVYTMGSSQKKAQIRKTLMHLGFIDKPMLTEIEKRYPVKCVSWTLVFFAIWFSVVILNWK